MYVRVSCVAVLNFVRFRAFEWRVTGLFSPLRPAVVRICLFNVPCNKTLCFTYFDRILGAINYKRDIQHWQFHKSTNKIIINKLCG